ncbi:MAG: hypothetical protein HRU19_25025 [Pseudobacteriovorax sp.]|nr:hypothetical protein [Pseudobacteriovorax sp.]
MFSIVVEDPIPGCTNPQSLNFDPNATVSNGSCIAKIIGCMDPTSPDFNPNANVSDSRLCRQIPSLTAKGFYRKTGTPEVFLNFDGSNFCFVDSPAKMEAFGGFDQVKVVDHVKFTGRDLGVCGWPNGLYRRSNEPEVFYLHGTVTHFNTASSLCWVTTEDKLNNLGGRAAVNIVPPGADLATGRNHKGACL